MIRPGKIAFASDSPTTARGSGSGGSGVTASPIQSGLCGESCPPVAISDSSSIMSFCTIRHSCRVKGVSTAIVNTVTQSRACVLKINSER